MSDENGLPPGWTEDVLSDFLLIQRGGSPRPIKAFITDDPDGVNWIKIGDVAPSSKYITTTKQKIVRSGMSRSRYVEPGDLLLSNSMSFGRPYILKIDGCIHDGWLVLKQSERHFVEKEFLYHWLGTPQISQRLAGLAKGSTVKNLNIDIVGALKVTIPPLKEQRRIVAKLDALQARSRRAREALDAIPALLDRFRQSVLAAAFRGDLTADWRAKNPDVEPASVLLERIRAERRVRWIAAEAEKARARAETRAVKKGVAWGAADDAKALAVGKKKAEAKYTEPEPVLLDDTSQIAVGSPLPNEWSVQSFDTVSALATGKTPRTNNAEFWNGNIPFITPSQINKNGTISAPPRTVTEVGAMEARLLHAGSVLLVCIGTVGKSGLLDRSAIFNQQINAATPFPSMNQQFFFRWCQFLKPWIEEAASATVNAAILNKGRLSQGPVIVPSKGEQAEIAERINGAFRAADIMQKQCKEASIRLNTLDQAILAKAFRGELVPQDPTDEPASVLLDRIRAEREAAAKKPKAKKRRKKT